MKLFVSIWHKANWMGDPMRLELTRVGLLVKLANHYTTKDALNNLQSSLLLCGTRLNEWGTQWDSNSLLQVCKSSLQTITLPEVPITIIYEALCFDVVQGRMNGAPNETRTHTCKFTIVKLANHYTTKGALNNLQRSLLRCGTRPNEWGAQWDSNSLV